MRRQKGISLSGLLVICVILVAVALLGFKLFPAYTEYFKVRKAVSEIARNPEYKSSVKEIQAAFDRRAAIDSISVVGGKDLEITKQGDGVAVSASWSVKVPLFYNVSACMDFEARGE
ncbi:MAG: DUF4845 domain-containing protein [Burkholderiales bacterium]|nr:DUF4845 domain-containing protein [Burkholderiales bacterium]